jgi:hypothetical protein
MNGFDGYIIIHQVYQQNMLCYENFPPFLFAFFLSSYKSLGISVQCSKLGSKYDLPLCGLWDGTSFPYCGYSLQITMQNSVHPRADQSIALQ